MTSFCELCLVTYTVSAWCNLSVTRWSSLSYGDRTNLTSEWLTWQSSSGELVFTLVSKWKVATLNTAVP